MKRWNLNSQSLMVTGLLLTACSNELSNRDRDQASLIARPAEPIVFNVQTDPAEREALINGDRRLEIAINAYEPPVGGSSGFVVSLVLTGNSTPVRINRFTLHPDAAFDTSSPESPQRFLISLAGYDEIATQPELILQVQFAPLQEQQVGGFAELELKWIDLSPR